MNKIYYIYDIIEQDLIKLNNNLGLLTEYLKTRFKFYLIDDLAHRYKSFMNVNTYTMFCYMYYNKKLIKINIEKYINLL